MKDKAAASLVFEPAMPTEDEGEAPESDAKGASAGKVDTLLGNAFDAHADGDRAGFIASLKAAIRAR